MQHCVLTISEAADYLNCSYSTLRRMIDNDAIPYFELKTGGGKKRNFRISKEKLDKWIEEQSQNDEDSETTKIKNDVKEQVIQSSYLKKALNRRAGKKK